MCAKMPPKKAGGADKPSKKTENKKKEKVIEDKTFGLKNKKGGKNQKFIAQVEKQVKSGGDPKARRIEEERRLEKQKKEDERKRLEEEKKLISKPVVTQKLAQGVDPKSVFCAFFKQGLCKKGDKCKFSHDPACERKAAKINVYADARQEDNMDDWDDEKLNEVVNKKHGGEKANKTDIICKHFLDALENCKYGWFWTCPNGGHDCMYRHALPAGYVLKKDKKREEKAEGMSIEELIEEKRAELSASAGLTPVTLESFVKWKRRKLAEKAEADKKEADKKKDRAKAGLTHGLSGRDMFSFNPTMAGGDDDDEDGGEALDMKMREKEDGDEDDGVQVHEIKFDEFGIMEDKFDEATTDRLKKVTNGKAEEPGGGAVGGAAAAAEAIDEDLFDDEDLDELEEDMGNLDV